MERSGARLWIHGHTHAPCNYTVGETQVICNPRGYPGESGNGFDLELVVRHGSAPTGAYVPSEPIDDLDQQGL